MPQLVVTLSVLLVLLGCDGQSALDKCTDSKAYLWNKEISGNQYEGNEAYWDAVKTC